MKPGAQKFCSQECYRMAISEGWRPQRKKEKENYDILVTVRGKCAVCKKRTEMLAKPEDVCKGLIFLCSDQCKERWSVGAQQ